MTTRGLFDPELLPLLDLLPAFEFSRESLPGIRAALESQTRAWGSGPELGPMPEVARIGGRVGDPPLDIHIHRPKGGHRPGKGVILHIHGGAMVVGSARSAAGELPQIVDELGVTAVSVDYRLAPETPFPGPQEDCYAALGWLAGQAAQWGADADRIVVMGESAGGGLAAALAQMARDRGEYRLAGQVLVYPMLDHRTGGPDCRWRNPSAGEFIFPAVSNQFGWQALRGDYDPVDQRKGWFSPALADDLSGLPPAFVSLAGLDLLVDEGMDYARRMSAAGVAVECHLYPGAPHGFNLIETARVTRQAKRDLRDALRRMLDPG